MLVYSVTVHLERNIYMHVVRWLVLCAYLLHKLPRGCVLYARWMRITKALFKTLILGYASARTSLSAGYAEVSEKKNRSTTLLQSSLDIEVTISKPF